MPHDAERLRIRAARDPAAPPMDLPRTLAALGRLGVTADSISTDDFMRDRAERHALGISGYDLRSLEVQALLGALARFALRHRFLEGTA